MSLTPEELAQRGIYTFETLGETLDEQVNWVMDSLLTENSVNLLAGDSGIGKTPLCLTLALCIAGGRPFLGIAIPRPRRVLYCDAESTRNIFHSTVQTISRYLGYPQVPENFHVWSPNWDRNQMGINYGTGLWKHAEWDGWRPEVIFVDPLRVFFPEADLKRDEALRVIKRMRRIPATWCIIHHTRKPPQDAQKRPEAIDDNPHSWFHEVAGQHAIINHVDTRLGVEATPNREGSEMTMGGFVRMLGPIDPIYLARSYNDEGEPQGYMRGSSLGLLIPDYREAYFNLPGKGEVFVFGKAREILGKSDGSCTNFLKRCTSIGALKKVPGGYVRTDQ